MADKVWTSDEIEDIILAKGVSQAEVNATYNDFAHVYDDIYFDPVRSVIVSKHLAGLLPNKECRILDIGAGTGLTGGSLKELGYTNIDAIEPAEQMLAKAKEKNIYTNIYQEYIGAHQTSLTAGSYDAVVIMDAFADGHITQECFPEIIRLLKNGGYFLTIIHHSFTSVGNIEEAMEKLREQGDWLRIHKAEHPNCFNGEVAYAYIYQKPLKK